MLGSEQLHETPHALCCLDMACRWFTRYSGWGPGQLQRECASGVWFTAAAGSAFILQQGEQDRGASGREMWHQVGSIARLGCVWLFGGRCGVHAPPVQAAQDCTPHDALCGNAFLHLQVTWGRQRQSMRKADAVALVSGGPVRQIHSGLVLPVQPAWLFVQCPEHG